MRILGAMLGGTISSYDSMGTVKLGEPSFARSVLLEKYPSLRSMYSPEDENTQVLYFRGGEAVFSSFTAAPETVRF